MMGDVQIGTVGMHTGGGPVRVVVSGFPKIEGETIMEKRAYTRKNLDTYRKFLMLEPRGHNDMYGAILVEPDIPEADAAVLFMDTEGYSTMCGHGLIAVARYCVDNKIAEYKEPEAKINIQCPCGLVRAWVKCCDGISDSVRFHSVPAFVAKLGLDIFVPNYGHIKVDISYGGAFYAFLPLQSIGLDVTSPIESIKHAAAEIKKVVCAKKVATHPEDNGLSFLYGIIFTDDNCDEEKYFNTVIFADTQVDRSPCGSGTTARMALLYAQGLVGIDQSRKFENPLTKSSFKAKVVKDTKCGDYDSVIVEVEGNPYYTGTATFTQEQHDPWREGFKIK